MLLRLQDGTETLWDDLEVASKMNCVCCSYAPLDRYLNALKIMYTQNLYGEISITVHNCQNLEATNTSFSKWRITKQTLSNGVLALKQKPAKTQKDIIEY